MNIDNRKQVVIIAVAILLTLVVAGRVVAAVRHIGRTETRVDVKTTEVSAKEKTSVKTAEKKPVEKKEAPKKKPAPNPIDPNGCEKKGMWWRADNYECIPKVKPEPAPAPEPVASTAAPAPAATGSGDCSLVNNYDWPVATAHRVCIQESRNDPNAANWSDDHTDWAGCMGSFGLMQINCSHGQVFNGKKNMDIAFSMFVAAGRTFWDDWPNTCRKVGC